MNESCQNTVQVKIFGRWGDFKGVVLMDQETFESIKDYSISVTSHGYARIHSKKHGLVNQYLHRYIMKNPQGKTIDHINGNRLDNRKENLRICNQRENSRNSSARMGTSIYKGGYENKQSWLAQITVDGKCYHIGSFDTQEEAALAYNEKAKEFHGDFAHLNVIKTPKKEWGIKKKKGQLKGEQANGVKLTSKEVLEIRALLEKGKHKHPEIGDMYGVHRRTIRDISERRTWKHLTKKEDSYATSGIKQKN